MTEHTVEQDLIKSIKSRTSAWNHDGGEALGSLGNKILGGYKLVIQPASPSSLIRVCVKVIDHYTNIHTPWFRNTQILPHRLRTLGKISIHRSPNPHATRTNMSRGYPSHTPDSGMRTRELTVRKRENSGIQDEPNPNGGTTPA